MLNWIGVSFVVIKRNRTILYTLHLTSALRLFCDRNKKTILVNKIINKGYWSSWIINGVLKRIRSPFFNYYNFCTFIWYYTFIRYTHKQFNIQLEFRNFNTRILLFVHQVAQSFFFVLLLSYRLFEQCAVEV